MYIVNRDKGDYKRLNHRIRLILYQNWKYSQPTDDLGSNGKTIPNERTIMFFNVTKVSLNLNAHQAKYPLICFDETPRCL